MTFSLTKFAVPVLGCVLAATAARAQEVSIPIIVPVTGPVALEGSSQRNGALLAMANAPASVKAHGEVVDTGGAPEGGSNALERVAGQKDVVAVVAPFFGTQVLPMLPLALEYKIPLIAPSGTGSLTEKGNPYMFRFFPSDEIAKLAQARYVTETLGKKRIAIVFNNTAYGQSGRGYLSSYIAKAGATVVFEEGVDLSSKDLSPVIAKLRAADPDVILLQMHSVSLALLLKQLMQAGDKTTIVANTMLSMPTTAALLEPSELKGICAETASWIGKGLSPAMDRFLDEYAAKFGGAVPDSFAVQQYDGLMMVLDAVHSGSRTSDDVQKALASVSYKGIAMDYKSDGKGNMAHSEVIVCFDGSSRSPKLATRYDDMVALPAK